MRFVRIGLRMSSMAAAGRPRRKTGTNRIRISATVAEVKRWEAAAREAGKPRETWCRDVLSEAAKAPAPERGPLKFLTAAEFVEKIQREKDARRIDGTGRLRFGDWVYEPSVIALRYRGHYDIDLERLTTSAEVLDAVCQVASHDYGVRDFMEAIRELMKPQAHLCSGGDNKGPIEVTREFIDRNYWGTR